MTDINKLRQVKEYSDQGGTYTVPYKGADAVWQPENGDIDPVKDIMAQQIDEEMKEYPLDPIWEAKHLIIDKITKHFQDVMFEMVCEEMSDNYLFQADNYLTPAGYDEFEDAWFEFYHEHHGDIMYEVMKNITN